MIHTLPSDGLMAGPVTRHQQRQMRHVHRYSVALLLVAACAGSDQRADSSTATAALDSAGAGRSLSAPSAQAIPAAALAAGDPAAALARFLAYESFRGAPSGSDSLSDCPPFVASEGDVEEGWEPDNYVGFVLARQLGVPVTDDTTRNSATGRAEVVRVASIDRDSGWVGTLSRTVDTLTFTLQRGATGWTVCGPATKPGTDSLPDEMMFVITYAGVQRTEVNTARWNPPGTTMQDAAKHADSVLAAGRRRE